MSAPRRCLSARRLVCTSTTSAAARARASSVSRNGDPPAVAVRGASRRLRRVPERVVLDRIDQLARAVDRNRGPAVTVRWRTASRLMARHRA